MGSLAHMLFVVWYSCRVSDISFRDYFFGAYGRAAFFAAAVWGTAFSVMRFAGPEHAVLTVAAVFFPALLLYAFGCYSYVLNAGERRHMAGAANFFLVRFGMRPAV